MNNYIQNIYLYVDKNDIDNCCKYGMKLSTYSSTSFKLKDTSKKGIIAYLSPKDSDKYNNPDYDILRIKLSNYKNVYIHDKSEENQICRVDKYNLGSYMNPEVFINSSIMPENIFKYNRILDVPLIVQNSKEFYIDRQEEIRFELERENITYDMLKNLK